MKNIKTEIVINTSENTITIEVRIKIQLLISLFTDQNNKQLIIKLIEFPNTWQHLKVYTFHIF